MKLKISIAIFPLILALVFPVMEAMSQEQKPLLQYVENIQQAKDILMSNQSTLMVMSDPFHPIIKPAPKESVVEKGARIASSVLDTLDDVRVVGIARLEKEYRAYIAIGSKFRVVNLQDKVRNYVVADITMDQVVFKLGNKEIIKKRGRS